ncbi:Metacaspase-1 [Asimina triloba]
MNVMMLVNCSNCRTVLQIPPGAQSIRCAVCQAVTHIADSSRNSAPTPHNFQNAPSSPSPSPSPYGHAPSSPPPSPHGRKKAVICGISYRHSRHELKGCINDAKCMRYLLVNRFRFPESSIIMLTEEETDPYKIPTKHNLRMAMFWLTQGCQPGDSLVFHYSGHGSRQMNYSGEEVDGYDETLCPLDFETQGMIVDDEINATLVRPLPPGAKLHAIIDACHSGTILDLPFLCRMNRSMIEEQHSWTQRADLIRLCICINDEDDGLSIMEELRSGQYVWEDHRPRSGRCKGTSGGEAISFSGCDDHQTSADTSALSRITSTGAMTFCFIQAIERGHGTTYGSILNSMRTTIRNTGNEMGGGQVTTLISMLLTGGSVGGGLRQNAFVKA